MRRMVNNPYGKQPINQKGTRNSNTNTPQNLTQRLHNRRGTSENYRTGHHKMGNARFK